jgi:hypothetical protein
MKEEESVVCVRQLVLPCEVRLKKKQEGVKMCFRICMQSESLSFLGEELHVHMQMLDGFW